ncbi:MAG: TetR/AcrR family transcriptional regulator, partial [Phascolarctobacterium sp.]
MKQMILAAALEEINMRGLRFTMQDLAARMKVSKRSLYENFTSKEELVGSLLDDILAEMARQEQAICESIASPKEKLGQLLTVHPYEAEMFNKNIYEDLKRLFPNQWQKVEASRLERQQRIEQLLQEGIQQGELRAVNVGLVGELIKDA